MPRRLHRARAAVQARAQAPRRPRAARAAQHAPWRPARPRAGSSMAHLVMPAARCAAGGDAPARALSSAREDALAASASASAALFGSGPVWGTAAQLAPAHFAPAPAAVEPQLMATPAAAHGFAEHATPLLGAFGASCAEQLSMSPTPMQALRATAPRSATRRRAAPAPPSCAADSALTEALGAASAGCPSDGPPDQGAPPGSGRARRACKRYADYVALDDLDGEATASFGANDAAPRTSSRGRLLGAPRRPSDASDCRSAPRARKAPRPAPPSQLLLALLTVVAAAAAEDEVDALAVALVAVDEPLPQAAPPDDAEARAALAARCAALVAALGV